MDKAFKIIFSISSIEDELKAGLLRCKCIMFFYTKKYFIGFFLKKILQYSPLRKNIF